MRFQGIRKAIDWANEVFAFGVTAGWSSFGTDRARISKIEIDCHPSDIARISVVGASSLNAAECSVTGEKLRVITDSHSGGYSALVPVAPCSDYDGATIFRCEIEVLDGAIGIAAVDAKCNMMVERVAGGAGMHTIDVIAPSLRTVAGLLIRNAASAGLPSRADIVSVSAAPYPREKITHIERNRPAHTLLLPLRRTKYPSRTGAEGSISVEKVASSELAVVILDIWNIPEENRASSETHQSTRRGWIRR